MDITVYFVISYNSYSTMDNWEDPQLAKFSCRYLQITNYENQSYTKNVFRYNHRKCEDNKKKEMHEIFKK